MYLMKRELPLKNKKAYIFLLLSFFILKNTVAQEIPDRSESDIIEATIEMIAENAEDEEIDYTTLFDDLNYLYQHPINLNNTTKDDLEQLILLNDIQINNLLEYIENTGKMIAIYELQVIDGFDLSAISYILPFIKVKGEFDDKQITPGELLRNGKHEVFLRFHTVLEEQKGFLPIDSADLAQSPNSRYLGSKEKMYARYRFKYSNNISIGMTAEKDVGEEFFNGTQSNGFDFYSAHIFAKNLGFVKRLAIGDYQVQLGQGLTMWSGLSFGKSAAAMNIKKNGQIIRPYTSVDENLFMRGGAFTLAFKNIELTGFYSQKKIDANISITDTSSAEIVEVTSFQQTGFHSTPSELEDKDAIGEVIYGGNLAYRTRKLSVGITATNSLYSAALNRSLQTYSQFEFSADQNSTLGIDYNYLYRNINFFGEVATSKNGGMAYLNGAIISLDPRLSISVFHRKYERDFQNLFSGAIGESSKNINEEGWYLGITSKINRKWTFTGYYDSFVFPWLRYRTDAPSFGDEWLAQLNYKPTRKIELYLRLRKENKQENTTEEVVGMDNLVDRKRKYLRFNASYKLSKELKLKSRVEISEYKLGDNPSESGYVLIQDVSYKFVNTPLTLTMRYASFDTESYNARIYSYESDVLYAYSIPAYYYRGTRMYFMLRYGVFKRVDLWLRYSQTYYDNRTAISSGLNEIQGNTKSEIKAQLRIKF